MERGVLINSTVPPVEVLMDYLTPFQFKRVKTSQEHCVRVNTVTSLHYNSVILHFLPWRGDQAHTTSNTALNFNNGLPPRTSEYH